MKSRKKKQLRPPGPEFIRAACGDLKLAKAAHKLVLSLRGRASKSKGGSNEDRSIAFVLGNYVKYKVPDKEHIYYTPRGTRFHKDLFSVEYKEKNGKTAKAGFDLACITDDGYTVLHLIQVKANANGPKPMSSPCAESM